MKRFLILTLFSLFLFGACSQQQPAAKSQAPKSRAEIADKYKWNLKDLYPSDEAWKEAKAQFEESFKGFEKYKGKLGRSAKTLKGCLDYYTDVVKTYYRLNSYAERKSDLDLREAEPLAMKQDMNQLGNKLNAVTSFIDPEILSIPAARIKQFMRQEPGLKEYRQYIANIQRKKAHTLSAKEEKLVADAGMMADSPYEVYGVFANAEMPRATIKLSDGTEAYLDAAGYTRYRAVANRADRKAVFEAFFGGLKDFEGTLGTNLYGQVKRDMFYKIAHKYNSSLESALDQNNVPTSVYMALIKSVRDNLPTLHRYLNLRKKMLGLDELRYYDMYPPLVPAVDLSYNVEEAQALIKEALQPLGEEYVKTLDIAFNNRWIDMFPTPGKRSGAYSTGSEYDVHPYILMNYNGQYDDVSTLAHELGHTMHSYFSNKNQTFLNSRYPIFLAEVASTCNENLLIEHVINKMDDPEKKLALLGSWLESYRTTLFRQTMFAEFELRMHEMAEQGKSLTGVALSKLYLDLLKEYYGDADGVTKIDDLYAIEWAYIPHFYYNFYVFQYATSYCASTALAENMLHGGPDMVKRYINDFLSAGRSDYPIPILQKVGVDMTTTEPFDKAMKKMNTIMDEIEKLLAD
ncbi:MAG TPA: oligoendopeptidase F [Caldithrix abyssi]|uniref:Oligopeptidase F n=1 Tax=Caldithrix abyssi TaxID=187145 RepID=A0A7V4WU39_CALAY|nr:oligoendopeptidase F [Caldithrix abyssi]